MLKTLLRSMCLCELHEADNNVISHIIVVSFVLIP